MLNNRLILVNVLLQILMICSVSFANEEEKVMNDSVHDFTVVDIRGAEQNLSDYRGKVLLIVNTASKCGFTPQFKGLETLYQKYSDRNFTILGFPCNQFGKQDPGTEEEILEFCQINYGVTFPMFSKLEVNGDNAHPLYKFLKSEAPGIMGSEKIKWNFTKFLIDGNGKVVQRFGSNTKPEDIEEQVLKLLSPTE